MKNYHDNFSFLIERINYSCFSIKKNCLDINKIPLFFHFIGQYFSQEVINKTEFNNTLEGASYDDPYLIPNVHHLTSSTEKIPLDALKKRIEKNI